jgi:hypothetical protein
MLKVLNRLRQVIKMAAFWALVPRLIEFTDVSEALAAFVLIELVTTSGT